MENFLYSIWIGTVISFIFTFLVFATCYHGIFKPDYRPGYKSMPFLWFPMVYSVYKKSQRAFILSKQYNLQCLSGMCKIFEKQGIVSFSICGRNYVYLFTPETVEVLLTSTKLIYRSSDYDVLRPMLKDGLFTSNGNKWRSRRKLLTPAFHFKILHDFAPLMQEASRTFLSDIGCFIDEPWVDITKIMRPCTFYMMMKASLGFDTEINEEAMATFNCAEQFTTCLAARFARPWLFPDFIFNKTSFAKKCRESCNLVHNYVRKIILDRRKCAIKERLSLIGKEEPSVCTQNSTEENEINSCVKKIKNKSFLDLLLELHFNDPSFTVEDILDESLIYFAAASDALGMSMSYLLYCIGLHQDVQKKIHKELDDIFQNTDREATLEDIKSMKYLDCVIKETQRLYGVHFLSREATESFKILDYTIPKGSCVVVFLHVIHRHPDFWKDPEKFDPSRFFPENSIRRNPYTYIPFAAGPRNCIAMKFSYLMLKIASSTLLRKFNLKSLDNRDDLYDINRLTSEDTIPIRISFSLRENACGY